MPVFCDTSFFIAFFNPNDTHHQQADTLFPDASLRMITTEWVLAEFCNFFAASPLRREVPRFVSRLRDDRRLRIVPFGRKDFESALELYRKRIDKKWSLTDCASFLAMKRLNIKRALTADHHFEQAGFEIVLKR